MTTATSGVPRSSALFAIAIVLLCGIWSCENDVGVHLLPPVSVESADAGRASALSFEGAYDRVEIASSPLLDLPQDFAIEAWVYVKSYNGGHGILNRWIAQVGDIDLTMGTPEPVSVLQLPGLDMVPSHLVASWAFITDNRWLTASAPTLPSAQSWHHLAASYGGGSFRLYVDGKLAGSMAGTKPAANPESTLFIGATARHERMFDPSAGALYWPPIDGFIAEVRLSSRNRYPAEFAPEARLNVDSGTIALWHLDEGSGNLAVDSGPNRLDGNVIGASWAPAPVRGANAR